jgi:phage baseplate assembly protein W
MSAVGFTIPFSFNSAGKVATLSDERDLWRSRVHLVILTRFGERLMRPGFGTDLSSTLFESEDVAVELAVKTISIAFNKWLTGLKLIEVTPQYDRNSGSLSVTISYKLPSGEPDEQLISTGILTGSGDLIQE